MATFSSNKSLPLLAFITIYLLALHKVNAADTLSFSFDKFDSEPKDLILQGDASLGSKGNAAGALQLTKVDNGVPQGGSVGRVLYTAPIRLGGSSAAMWSFDTTFTFSISAPSSTTPGDGLAFFLANTDTTIPPNSGGSLLGLFSTVNAVNNSRNEILGFKASSDKVVAVEFDTYSNDAVGDPKYRHVGIDLNSIRSSATGRWDWQSGRVATAHITYNSASRRLTAVTSYPNASPVTVSHDVDLNTILPEWVRVGFSAATGQYSQTNTLLSWSFSSTVRRNPVATREVNCLARVV